MRLAKKRMPSIKGGPLFWEGVQDLKRTAVRNIFLTLFMLTLVLTLSGCDYLPFSSKYETEPDYKVTEPVATDFMEAYVEGDWEQALEYVDDEAVLITAEGQTKGKEVYGEMIKHNTRQDTKMEILNKKKVDESKIEFQISNVVPLYQICGVDMIKTIETIEVQDSKIVQWEIEYSPESMELIGEAAAGTVGIEVEEKDGLMIISDIIKDSPAAAEEGLRKGDRIKAINGLELKDMEYGIAEVPYRLIGKVGTEVTLTMVKGSRVYDVVLTRIDAKEID